MIAVPFALGTWRRESLVSSQPWRRNRNKNSSTSGATMTTERQATRKIRGEFLPCSTRRITGCLYSPVSTAAVCSCDRDRDTAYVAVKLRSSGASQRARKSRTSRPVHGTDGVSDSGCMGIMVMLSTFPPSRRGVISTGRLTPPHSYRGCRSVPALRTWQISVRY